MEKRITAHFKEALNFGSIYVDCSVTADSLDGLIRKINDSISEDPNLIDFLEGRKFVLSGTEGEFEFCYTYVHWYIAEGHIKTAEECIEAMRIKETMCVTELNRNQIKQLKALHLSCLMEEGISYGELEAVDELVTDEEIFEEYAGTRFTEDDFFN